MRKLTKQQKDELEAVYQKFLNDEKVQKMNEIQMHRGSSCYIHSFRVAKLCVKKAARYQRYSFEDLKNVLVASILHDYYLYDWRKHRELKKKHGRRHPLVACENAVRDFNIPIEVQEIIKTHMWPLTLRSFPNSKEAIIVCIADKICALKETIFRW